MPRKDGRQDVNGPHGRPRVVRFFGDRRALLAWRWRVADLVLCEGDWPAPVGSVQWVMTIRLTPADLSDLAAHQWAGDSGLNDASGRPVTWNEVLACEDMPAT